MVVSLDCYTHLLHSLVAEGCRSGRTGAPEKRLALTKLVGSNPTPSAHRHDEGAGVSRPLRQLSAWTAPSSHQAHTSVPQVGATTNGRSAWTRSPS